MKRREFLTKSVLTTATTALAATGALTASGIVGPTSRGFSQDSAAAEGATACCDRTYATPQDAMRSARETLLYVPAIYTGTDTHRPDYLATVDVDPESPQYGQVVHRLSMPHVGDELHHFGWNSCSSCHGQDHRGRRYIVLPGISSSRIHIVDTINPRAPSLHKVLEPEEIREKTNLSAPHTVHCLGTGEIMISMLGDGAGNGPGGFLLLNDDFTVQGRWERHARGMNYNYDFWYQPRHNVMISSEWGAPNTVSQGFRLEDVQAGKYGRHLHFWDWNERVLRQSIDLGEKGLIPLEVRFHHHPDSQHGFVGAALSSQVWHWYHKGDQWRADPVIAVDPVAVESWPFPVPGLITDLVLSMDDRWLYFSNWLHGDIRQYDVRDPFRPRLAGQVWLGGVIGHERDSALKTRSMTGGPQMLQLSLDGKRLYVSNSLYSPWDNQFYPDMARLGSYVLRVDCDTDQGGLRIAPDFFVDFGQEPDGPARAHEMRFPGGDSTSDIWM